MKVTSLTREHLTQLKQSLYCNVLNINASWGELANIDALIPDSLVYRYYEDIEFTEEDFI